jgi:hypothetical protein
LFTITEDLRPDWGLVTLLREDQLGNIYLKKYVNMSSHPHQYSVSIRKYSSKGALLASIPLPVDYYPKVPFHTIEIDKYGSIYILHTTKQGVQIIKWESK